MGNKLNISLNKERIGLNNFAYLLPIIFFLISVFIVYPKGIKMDFSGFKWINLYDDIMIDIFSYEKSRLIIFSALISIFVFIYQYRKGELSILELIDKDEKTKKNNFKKVSFTTFLKFRYIEFYLLIILTLLSFLFSEYKSISQIGYLERYEGFYVMLSYFIMAIYISYVLRNNKVNFDRLISLILLVGLFLGILGTMQYFKIDIFKMNFFKEFISKVLGGNANVNILVPEGRVYLTVYNPNYVGVIMSVFVLLALNTIVYSKNNFNKLISIIGLPMFIISELGSYSRSGMIAMVVALFVFLILNIKNQKINKLYLIFGVLLLVITVFAVDKKMNGFVKNRFKSIFNVKKIEAKGIKDITLGKDTITINYNDEEYKFLFEKTSPIGLVLIDGSEKIMPTIEKKNYFNVEGIKNITIAVGEYQNSFFWQFTIDRIKWNFTPREDGIKYINQVGNLTDIPKVDVFKPLIGYERIGSNRGYIWSRSIPLIYQKPLFGHGPDTYALAFPQEDYIGKSHFMHPMSMIVDKPHNTYLQYAINTGLIALIIYVCILFRIIIVNFKNRSANNYVSSLVITTIVVIIVVNMFNDSTVSTSPLLWTIIGLGYSEI